MKMNPSCKGRGRVLVLLGPDPLFISPLCASQGEKGFVPLRGRRAILRQGVPTRLEYPGSGNTFSRERFEAKSHSSG